MLAQWVQPDLLSPVDALNGLMAHNESTLLLHDNLRKRAPRGIHVIDDDELMSFNRNGHDHGHDHGHDGHSQGLDVVPPSTATASVWAEGHVQQGLRQRLKQSQSQRQNPAVRVRQIKNFDAKYNGKEVNACCAVYAIYCPYT